MFGFILKDERYKMTNHLGQLITFEGIEGSGKSTQMLKLCDYLTQKGCSVVATKEPGGTDFGMDMRRMILNPNQPFFSKKTEIMLFYADRLEHVEGVIKPALAAGKIVVCDRYFDSTLAYQWGGRHMPKDLLMVLQDQVDLSPHLTLVLDLPPEEGMRRAVERSALDRFEQEEIGRAHV